MIVTKLAERLLPTSECQGSDPINDFCIIVLQMSVEKRGKGERERERFKLVAFERKFDLRMVLLQMS